MKATGIVRRIDDLGRVVIPKEIRRTMRIREGDPLEIYVDREGEVILKKYSPLGELENFAQGYTDSLYESTGHIACISDKDAIVAVSGAPKKQFLDKPISDALEEVIESRKPVLVSAQDGAEAAKYPILKDDDEGKFFAHVIAPIVADGEAIGAVILSPARPGEPMGELELKLAQTASAFLARQLAE